jgi:guanine deaminase
MQEAVALSRRCFTSGEGGPFGCVIVRGDEIIGRGWNQVLATNDPTAHAEITAIRDACTHIHSFNLEGCELYTSCEPCPMCLGAIYWARPDKVFFGNTREDAADIGFDDALIYRELTLPAQERIIPAVMLGRELAIEVFNDWKAAGKHAYY